MCIVRHGWRRPATAARCSSPGRPPALLPTPPLPGATLRDLGEHRLKDLPEPMRVYDLVVDGLDSDFPPIRSLGRGNLPEPLTSFIGREREIGDILGLLERSRIVTLTGPGGTGKTRLSIEVARRRDDEFPDGAWFVPLETVTDPDMVLPAIGHSLGVREDASRPLADSLAEALGQRRLLLVLDNLEQVVAAAPAIGGLLKAAHAPRVLCSSREALRISGEQEYPVPPLDSDPAIELVHRAGAGRASGFRPERGRSRDDRADLPGGRRSAAGDRAGSGAYPPFPAADSAHEAHGPPRHAAIDCARPARASADAARSD